MAESLDGCRVKVDSDFGLCYSRIGNLRLGGAVMRVGITLACSQCKQRNYVTTKDKRKHPEKMEIRKYCRFCNTHTLHKETK
ncbi:ribosomal protein L33 [Syntrophothermus lipocalidus DSM 12680]|uniref:Large ribosomal subunit protein bL33 n=1 Tax=Syntrophothermus lipocalidus (strain DSM 12680 / TGB-C1) TaxID=643648 RepID=D7CJN9_SYNLT|nr:ribosomal protein L33 [Syntrophothermus lipocalidus DSM 12680]